MIIHFAMLGMLGKVWVYEVSKIKKWGSKG
jgi:hypothetical protein